MPKKRNSFSDDDDFTDNDVEKLRNISSISPKKQIKPKEIKDFRASKSKDFNVSELEKDNNKALVRDKPKELEKVRQNEDLTLPRGQHEAGRVPQNQVALPPMDESGDVDLNKLFSSELGNESDVLKELFSSENVKVKTDLTPNQISIISRLELQASITQNFYLNKVLKELETLLISKNRLSRGEFVQSFGGQRQQAETAFNKIGKVFSQDKV